MHARWRSADHRVYYLYELPREVAASEQTFGASLREGATLPQVGRGRLPNRQFVNTAYLLIRLSTEDRRLLSSGGGEGALLIIALIAAL